MEITFRFVIELSEDTMRFIVDLVDAIQYGDKQYEDDDEDS